MQQWEIEQEEYERFSATINRAGEVMVTDGEFWYMISAVRLFRLIEHNLDSNYLKKILITPEIHEVKEV